MFKTVVYPKGNVDLDSESFVDVWEYAKPFWKNGKKAPNYSQVVKWYGYAEGIDFSKVLQNVLEGRFHMKQNNSNTIEHELREQLLTMAAQDQKLREELLNSQRLFDGYNEELEKLHYEHAQRLEKIIQAKGWPTESMVSPGCLANIAACNWQAGSVAKMFASVTASGTKRRDRCKISSLSRRSNLLFPKATSKIWHPIWLGRRWELEPLADSGSREGGWAQRENRASFSRGAD